MSTSLLYHGFGIRGYRYVKTTYEAGRVTFTIRQEPGDLRCAACGSGRVVRRGFQSRCFRSLPIGARPVQIELDVPRVGCADCGEVRQVPVGFAEERRTYTHAFERYVLELSHHMTIRDVAEHLAVGWDLVKGIQKRSLSRRLPTAIAAVQMLLHGLSLRAVQGSEHVIDDLILHVRARPFHGVSPCAVSISCSSLIAVRSFR